MNAIERRRELAQSLLGGAYEDLTPIQKSVIDLIATEAPTGVGPELASDDRTFWERLADNVASIGGSWTFIFGFMAGLAVWMAWNLLTRHAGLAFDPYPSIFLNLMLSMLAALQAPVIMMSQNRAAARDREAAEHDYVVNLRCELEIMHLHDKLDALRAHDLHRLLERQNEVIEAMKGDLARLSRS
jgi:uncharacterized membrane protein